MDKKIRVIVICFLAIVVFLIVGKTYGKIIYSEIRDFYLSTKSFYFNSDKLQVGLSNQQIDNWSGADSYSIGINMNSYKNNKVGANSDISYDISYECSENANCSVSKSYGVIYASSNTDSFVVNIEGREQLQDGDEVWVIVTATSTSPYVKTLKGKFTLKVGKMGLSYEIVDVSNRPYMDVHITNTLDFYTVEEAFDSYSVGDRIDIETYLGLDESYRDKCKSASVSISFDPSVVVFDMTNSVYLRNRGVTTTLIDGYSYINGISFRVDALSSEVVRFYKSDASSNYSYPLGEGEPIVDVVFD